MAAEVAERLKKQEQQHQQSFARVAANNDSDLNSKVVTRGLIDGIANVKLIKNDNNKERFLGQAGGGIRSGSVDKARPSRLLSGQGDFKILTDSSTIPAINITAVIASQIVSKPFKTMPSPTRTSQPTPSAIASNCLKEIFEEGDAGSSDNSNTNTPRPIIRSTHGSSATSASTASSTSSHHHRRTKFHKSRTTSCSSSDASDDDNSDKKRNAAAAAATSKMVDSAIKKQFNFQRRDSDSSDSQDPGTGCSGSNSAGSSLILKNGATSTTTTANSKSSTSTSSQNSGGSGGE